MGKLRLDVGSIYSEVEICSDAHFMNTIESAWNNTHDKPAPNKKWLVEWAVESVMLRNLTKMAVKEG